MMSKPVSKRLSQKGLQSPIIEACFTTLKQRLARLNLNFWGCGVR
jgi:hypothetical protein